MNASKFSALVLFLVIVILCLTSDSHSTSRLESHVKLGRNMSDNKISSMPVNVHYAFKTYMFNKIPHGSVDRKTPSGPNPLHNDVPLPPVTDLKKKY